MSLPLILYLSQAINIVPDEIIGSILRLKYGKDELMNAASRSKSDASERNTSGLLQISFDCGSWYDISKSLKTMTKKEKVNAVIHPVGSIYYLKDGPIR